MRLHSRVSFIALTVFYILVQFLIGHAGLVLAYKTESKPFLLILFSGLLLCAILLLIMQPSYRFFPLFTAVLLWSVLGEMSEHFGWFSLVNKYMILILIPFVVATVIILTKSNIPDFIKIVTLFFSCVWAGHFIMITFFDAFGKIHPATFASSSIFIIALGLSLYYIFHLNDQFRLTLLSIIFTCTAWSLLEYLWAWKWLIKPW